MILILLIAFTTWRFTCDYTQEHGPFGLYYWLRTRLKKWAEAKINQSDIADPTEHPWYWLYDGADCFVCISGSVLGLLTLLAWIFIGLNWSEVSVRTPAASLIEFLLVWGTAATLARFIDAIYTHIVTTKP